MRWHCFTVVVIVALGGFALRFSAAGATPADDSPFETIGEKSGEVAARDARRGDCRGTCDVGMKSTPMSIVRCSRDGGGHAARAMRSGPVWRSAVPADEARWTGRLPACDAESSFRSAATLQSRSIRLQI
jgi:hypothetical protein